MKISAAFPSKYLKATEMEGDVTYTISHVEVETLGEGKDADTKPVVYFNENDKGLALNKTNANTISDLYGDDTDDWKGRAITLFATEVDFQGKQTLAIRVRMKKPAAAAPTSSGINYRAEARRIFDEKVAAHNAVTPDDAYKPGEADEVYRKCMGSLFTGRTAASLAENEWKQAAEAFKNEFSAATREFVPF